MREFTLPYSYRSAFIIYDHPNHFQAGVFLHIMADALGSIVVMISASVIWLTDWKYKYVLQKYAAVTGSCVLLTIIPIQLGHRIL